MTEHQSREKFATQMDSALLADLRALAKSEGRQLQSLIEEAVGKLIWKVLTDATPKTRYAIVRDWMTGWIVPNALAPRALDRIIAKRFGLNPKP